jgi:hypothetical protein
MIQNFLRRLFGANAPASAAASAAASAPDEQPAPIEHYTVRGFPITVQNTRPDIATPYVLERLGAALDLISTYAPRRFRRLRQDLAEIRVHRFACRAAYFPEQRACLVELTFTVNSRHDLPEIAASIVHEGVHARVAHMCRPRSPDQLPREERLCRQAELEFGLSVPGGDVVVERARASLALEDTEVAPAVDWAEAEQRVAEADRRSGNHRS